MTSMNAAEKKFFKALNSYIETIVEDWDAEEFKEVFEKNIPRLMKKEKKADAVKKPKTVFICFSTDPKIRDKVKNENPGATAKEITSKIGELWKSTSYRKYSNEGKHVDSKSGKTFDYRMDKVKKWFDMVKNDKTRYVEEMEEKGLEIPKPKEKKESTKPKTAYNYFCLEVRPEIKESLKDEYNGKELTKAVGEKLKETWEEYKDRESGGTQKDKNGKFEYTEEANRWLKMAEKDKKRMDKINKQKKEQEEEEKEEGEEIESEQEEEVKHKKDKKQEKKSEKKQEKKSEKKQEKRRESRYESEDEDDDDEQYGYNFEDDEDYYSDYEEDYELQASELKLVVKDGFIKVSF
jgi:hypothetical protein